MRRFLLLLFSLLALTSCGITKLQEGERRLSKSRVKLSKEAKEAGIKTTDISPYVRTAELYDERLQASSESNIEGHLTFLGFYDSEVTSSVRLRKKRAKITYTVVSPGHRIKIDSIRFFVPDDSEFSELFERNRNFVSIKPGNYLCEKDLVAESERCSKYFHEFGYYNINSSNFTYVADTIEVKGKLILDYNINAQPVKYQIGDINLSYPANLKFNEKYFKGLVTLKSGEQYSDRSVNKAYNRLSALKVFNGINIEMTPRDSTNLVDCNINLTPGQIQGVKFNFEASSNSNGLIGLSPQLSYYHNNIFHGGEKLSIGFKGNFQFKVGDTVHSNEYGIQAAIKLPRFLGIKYEDFKAANIPSTEFAASYNYQNRPEYKRNMLSFTYSYIGDLRNRNNYFSYQLTPIRISAVKLSDMSQDFYDVIIKNPLLWYSYTDHLNAGITASCYFSNSPMAIPRTSYRYLRASLSLSGNLLSIFHGVMRKNADGEAVIAGLPYAQYAKGEISLGETWRFGKDDGMAIAARLQMGIGGAYGNSTSMPFEEQFYCGGANSMRGWQARTLGPGSEESLAGFIIPSQSGDIKLEADLEFRCPIFWKLEGAIFAEAGNVWRMPYKDIDIEYDPGAFDFRNFAKQLGADWGLGLRLNFDFLLVRFDFGMKLHDPSRDPGETWLTPAQWFKKDGFAFHFGVGYPF